MAYSREKSHTGMAERHWVIKMRIREGIKFAVRWTTAIIEE